MKSDNIQNFLLVKKNWKQKTSEKNWTHQSVFSYRFGSLFLDKMTFWISVLAQNCV